MRKPRMASVNYFEKCMKCVPPERKSGCQDHCPHYAEGRARLEADKAKANVGRDIKYYINDRLNNRKDASAKYAKKQSLRSRH